ncbi:Echinoderm microtubule-associated protein-like 1 [Bagarius yarrelli]|uniref:Echinoderm microtubule-associated protein-like 1 n=1 Tax=Bagarius yarrelli TaxID=175774 RepID=A0A556TSN5_BAGYA|nr:Echinoderm microtubule-associated protein-like 1 [Bagarius yarrelli]
MAAAAVAAMVDAHMKKLVERSRAGDEEAQLYHDDSLLAPEIDFIVDEHSSAHSNMEVTDRLMSLEQRLQMQEDEVQLLKIALADVLKRLNISEEQTAAHTKKQLASRPVSLALPPRTSSNTANSLKKSSGSTLPSSTSLKNYSPSPASKRGPGGSPKNSLSVSASRYPAPPTSTTSTPCKKLQERDSSGDRCEMEVRRRSAKRRRPEENGRASRALDATASKSFVAIVKSSRRLPASAPPRQPATQPAC